MADRWKRAKATRSKGTTRASFRPLHLLMIHRQALLAAGRPSYEAPLRLIASEDWVLAEPQGGLITSGRLLAPAGETILREEARLAGAFGQAGVYENLDMICAIAIEAGAGEAWVEQHVEEPALETIRFVHGTDWKGATAGKKEPDSGQTPQQKADARRKRIPKRKRQGREALEKYFGPGWERAVFNGDPPDPKTGRWKVIRPRRKKPGKKKPKGGQ